MRTPRLWAQASEHHRRTQRTPIPSHRCAGGARVVHAALLPIPPGMLPLSTLARALPEVAPRTVITRRNNDAAEMSLRNFFAHSLRFISFHAMASRPDPAAGGGGRRRTGVLFVQQATRNVLMPKVWGRGRGQQSERCPAPATGGLSPYLCRCGYHPAQPVLTAMCRSHHHKIPYAAGAKVRPPNRAPHAAPPAPQA